jgi:hypothetical protein
MPKDESHWAILELEAAIEEYRANPTAYARRTESPRETLPQRLAKRSRGAV